MLQEIWAKVNPRERLAVIGAGLIILSWLLGIVLTGGFIALAGTDGIALLGAIAVLVIVYLRYAPNSTVKWPVPYPVLLFGISAVVGLIALLDLFRLLPYLGDIAIWGGASVLVVLVLEWVGAALMVWGSYQEWQLNKNPA